MYLILLVVTQPNQIPGRTTLALPLWKSNRGLRFHQVYDPHRSWDSSPLFCFCSVRPGLLFRVTLRDEASFCSLLCRTCFASCRFCKQLRAAFKDSVSTLFGTVLVSRLRYTVRTALDAQLEPNRRHVCSIFTEKRRRVQSARPSSADRCSRRPGQRWYHPSQLSSRSRLLAGLSARYCQ